MSTPAQYQQQLKDLDVSTSGHFNIPFIIGHSRVAAMFDSGCQITSVSDVVLSAEPTHFELIRKMGSHDIHGEPIETSLYWAKNPEFSGLGAKETVMDFHRFPPGLINAEAIFGFNWMVHRNWIFDLRNNKWATFD